MVFKKDDDLLKQALSKDGPRVREAGCVRNGHKPVYVTYGYPPRRIQDQKPEKKG